MNAEDRCCPRCGSRTLHPVHTAEETNLFCTTCQRCWFREHGYLIEVNHHACPGCAEGARCMSP